MPSIDEDAIVELYRSGKTIFIAEQNNGYIWHHFRKVLFERQTNIDTKKLIPLNTTTSGGLHYIHSGTYPELAAHYGLDSAHLKERILKSFKTKKAKANTI
jgi:hypothetical protein